MADADRSARRQVVAWGIAGLSLLGLVGVLLIMLFDPLSSLRDRLFGEEDTPVAGSRTVIEIRETRELRAATGEYSVPVFFGVEPQSGVRQYIPDVIDGDSGVAIYQGSVDALIDLRGLTEDDVQADPEAKRLSIRVPEPTLTEPNLDESESTVVLHKRGAATRLADAFSGNPLDKRDALDAKGVEAIALAARESELQDTARTNGRSFLTSLGRQMGYDDILVEYIPAP